MPFPFSTENIV